MRLCCKYSPNYHLCELNISTNRCFELRLKSQMAFKGWCKAGGFFVDDNKNPKSVEGVLVF